MLVTLLVCAMICCKFVADEPLIDERVVVDEERRKSTVWSKIGDSSGGAVLPLYQELSRPWPVLRVKTRLRFRSC